ncbi:MAG: PIN domain-containing protein [Candidatus Rokubacteria bacterium]|nr:PIN domain-containing protein [Candidatus Rokubacteria bacterium]
MVVDASVIVSRLVTRDVNHEISRRWLDRHVADGGLIVAPAVLLPEVAGAITRRTGRRRLARRAIAALLRLPELRLVTIDAALAEVAARLAGDLKLRGADALYVATAARLRLALVTWDVEQQARGGAEVAVVSPSAER